jgi:hypothetical protein
MVAYEDSVAAVLIADTTLMATLTGGVLKSSTVGPAGITRETVASAFGTDGYLKPCALVKQRGNVPNGVIRDEMAQIISAAQVVEVYIYADASANYTAVDTALGRIIQLLEGRAFTGSFPCALANIIDRQRDPGALFGAAMARADFLILNVIALP